MFKFLFGPKVEEGKEIIQNHLKSKYGEYFNIHSLLKRDGRFYGSASSSSFPALEFEMDANKKLTEINDGYMNAVMSKKLDEVLPEELSSLFTEEIKIRTEIDFGEEEQTNKNMNVIEYLKKDSELFVTVDLFIHNIASIVPAIEADRILNVLSRLSSLHILHGEVIVYYVKSHVFNDALSIFEELKHSRDGIASDLFSSKEYTNHSSYISFSRSAIDQTKEEIIEDLNE
jgi:hypothetical protein